MCWDVNKWLSDKIDKIYESGSTLSDYELRVSSGMAAYLKVHSNDLELQDGKPKDSPDGYISHYDALDIVIDNSHGENYINVVPKKK